MNLFESLQGLSSINMTTKGKSYIRVSDVGDVCGWNYNLALDGGTRTGISHIYLSAASSNTSESDLVNYLVLYKWLSEVLVK